ncbi:MAG TPA: hypothetical protein VEW64_07425, partial [Methyloceanibacter sp.]|nr:hypothetical protein [Methyloceanibacter sp.]
MAKGPAKQPAGARAPQWHVAAIEIARIVAVVAGVVALVALLWFARTALLLLFAGILLAVLLDGLSRPLMRWTGMPKPAALSVGVLGIGIFLSLVAWNAGPVLVEQLEELGRTYFGLLLLGIPLAFLLALLLGMFEFIPYIGPILG